MRNSALTLTLIAAAISTATLSSASAQDIKCNAHYKTKPGDSMASIAKRAYGRATAYPRIRAVNADVLGRDPIFVPIGRRIWIPCETANGERPSAPAADLAAIRQARGKAVRIVTGTDYPPFVDPGLPNGGLSRELMDRALQVGSAKLDYRIDTVKDWGWQIKTALPDGMYDVSFPWFKPDCKKLPDNPRCKFFFSEVLNSVVVTYYARSDDNRKVVQPKDLYGSTICRPSGYFTFDFEERGLVKPNVVRYSGKDPEDCFKRLLSKEVDYVSVNAETGDAMLRKLAATDKVKELIDLADELTLHAITPKEHPRGRAIMLRVSQGLRALKRDGTYVEVVKSHLRAANN